MIKRDLSMIALIFFVTRCFFNLHSFYNIYSFLFTSLIIFIGIIFLKRVKKDILDNKIIKALYLLIIIYIFIMIIVQASQFINTNYFRYDNTLVVVISLLVISYIVGKDQIKTIGSISEILLFIFIIISIIASIGLISLLDIKNYKAFTDLKEISVSIYPIFILFILFYLRKNNIVTGYILGIGSCLFDLFLLIGCLGSKLIQQYKFPGIAVLKSLNLFHFINHLDKLLSFIYLFEYTITLSLIVYIIKDIIKKTKLKT